MNKSVMILEPPSLSTLAESKKLEIKKTMPLGFEVSVKKVEEEVVAVKRKRKEPNSLSQKKKKVRTFSFRLSKKEKLKSREMLIFMTERRRKDRKRGSEREKRRLHLLLYRKCERSVTFLILNYLPIHLFITAM